MPPYCNRTWPHFLESNADRKTPARQFEERKTYYPTSWSGENPSDRTTLHPSDLLERSRPSLRVLSHTSLKDAIATYYGKSRPRFPPFKYSGICQVPSDLFFPYLFGLSEPWLRPLFLDFPESVRIHFYLVLKRFYLSFASR